MIADLLAVMARLRDPERGCPWDLEQTFATIAPYTVEEAYEVADAIERGDLTSLEDELGDLLLQVVYHARLAEEAGAFSFAEVTRRICEKMVRRHPHVFGGEDEGRGGHPETWDALKRRERPANEKVLAGVPVNLPALTRAVKLGRRASRVGFDWPDARGPREKVDEELAELDHELAELGGAAMAEIAKAAKLDGTLARQGSEHGNEAASDGLARIRSEVGDVLLALANLCRHLDVDPEQCARDANRRFESRFEHVEAQVKASGRGFDEHTQDELEHYWIRAKEQEKHDPPR